MPFTTNTSAHIRTHQLKTRTDYAAYVLTKQSVETNGPVKSVSGMTTFTEVVEGDVYTKLDDLNFILANHSPATAAVVASAPTEPTFNASSGITSTGFTVNWSGGTGAISYIYTLDGSDTTPSSSNAQSATFTGLSASTTYSVIVTAINSTGSTVSTPLSVTTLIPPPTQPIFSPTTSITSSGFTVNWSGATGASSYMYTLGISAATPSSPSALLGTATSATFTGLSANTTYSVMVTAVNVGGSTSSIQLSVTTLIAAPTQPSLSLEPGSATSSGFTISWSGATGASSYTYTLNGSVATPSSQTATSATFTGLSASTAYSVIVTAINSTGSAVSSALSVTTLIPPPTQPAFNQPTSITSTGFTVNWSGGSGASSYTYTLNGSAATPSSSTAQSATFTSLTASTTYSVIVTAINSTGTAVSSPSSVTTLIPPPTQPTFNTTTSITSSGFVLNWSGGTGASSYTYTLNGSPATPSSPATLVGTVTSATFTGLSASTDYNVIVTAVNVGGSTSSLPLSVTTLIPAPTQPSLSLQTGSTSSSGFTVNWSGGSGASSYTYSLNGSAATPSSATTQSATFTGLSASTAYNVIVTAVNNTGSTSSLPLSVTTLIAAPTQPTDLSSNTITSTAFTISWTGGTGASSYTYTLNGSAATASSSTAQSATFTGLAASTTYSVIVTAVNSTGSTVSTPLSVTTLISPPTQLSLSLQTGSTTSSGFIVNWSGGSGADSYTYTLNGSAATPSSSTTQSATFTGLSASTAYSVIVTAVNNGGSTVSSPLSVTTLIAAPTQPSFNPTTSITATAFTVNWTGGTGASSYTYTLNGSAATASSSTAQSATFTGLAASTTYSVIVTAINSTGSTVSSPLSVTTAISPPTQPTFNTTTSISATAFTVNWSGGSGATSYTYTLNGNAATPSSFTASSATFTSLTANTAYSVIVRAVNDGGSTSSSSLSVSTYPSNSLVSLKASSYSGSGTWNDESGNGRNATKAYGTIAKNVAGNGIVLNGSSSWTFANLSAGNAWTMSVWYKQTANTTGYPMVAGQLNSPYNMILAYDPTQTYTFGFYDTAWRKGSTFTNTLNTWVHLVGTWNGSSLSTYKNGAILGTTTPGGTATSSSSVYSIGRDTNAHFAQGEIGEVTIFNTALSATQITQMYNNSRATYGL